MTDSDEKAKYEQEFIARVKAARRATGKKQWQVAELMGIKQDQYKHYETGRVIPHHLIGRFCLICNVDPNWLITGKGPKPLQPPQVVETEPAPVPKVKRIAKGRQHRLHRM
jgi:transcriptional regulator with XRE-family HTH domain